MARNFRVCATEHRDRRLKLQLFGDFDASSAFELLNLLKTSVKRNATVAIDTDGLRTVNAFGLDLFLPRMTRLAHTRVAIEVTGRFSAVFQES